MAAMCRLLSIMYTEEVTDVDTCLDVVEATWPGPVDYAAAAEGWLNLGVRMIGGCCGVGPTHIRTLTTRS